MRVPLLMLNKFTDQSHVTNNAIPTNTQIRLLCGVIRYYPPPGKAQKSRFRHDFDSQIDPFVSARYAKLIDAFSHPMAARRIQCRSCTRSLQKRLTALMWIPSHAQLDVVKLQKACIELALWSSS